MENESLLLEFYVISDHHFGHGNIISYTNRPFSKVKEMDKFMIKAWNTIVSEEDSVLYLGDIFLCSTSKMIEIMGKLNRKYISIVKGNHDSQSVTKLTERLGFDRVYKQGLTVKLLGYKVEFSHRPLSIEEMKEKSVNFNIHGHTHQNLYLDSDVHFCVTVECLNYTPIKVREVLDILISRGQRNG